MGLLDNIKDKFKNAEFTVAPQKKLKSLSSEFKNSFGVSLIFYKGAQIADGELSLPMSPTMTIEEVAEVVRLINEWNE